MEGIVGAVFVAETRLSNPREYDRWSVEFEF